MLVLSIILVVYAVIAIFVGGFWYMLIEQDTDATILVKIIFSILVGIFWLPVLMSKILFV